jgi:hypothetical protein
MVSLRVIVPPPRTRSGRPSFHAEDRMFPLTPHNALGLCPGLSLSSCCACLSLEPCLLRGTPLEHALLSTNEPRVCVRRGRSSLARFRVLRDTSCGHRSRSRTWKMKRMGTPGWGMGGRAVQEMPSPKGWRPLFMGHGRRTDVEKQVEAAANKDRG